VAVVGGVLMWWLAPTPASAQVGGRVTVSPAGVGVTF
jgi:hypothetical protein